MGIRHDCPQLRVTDRENDREEYIGEPTRRMERLEAKVGMLSDFARRVIGAPRGPDCNCLDYFSRIDGGDLQDIGEKTGILVKEIRTRPCGPDCNCLDYFSRIDMAQGFECWRLNPEIFGKESSDA